LALGSGSRPNRRLGALQFDFSFRHSLTR
jgi:hypothetical protein